MIIIGLLSNSSCKSAYHFFLNTDFFCFDFYDGYSDLKNRSSEQISFHLLPFELCTEIGQIEFYNFPNHLKIATNFLFSRQARSSGIFIGRL